MRSLIAAGLALLVGACARDTRLGGSVAVTAGYAVVLSAPDSDGDGRLSLDEALAPPRTAFACADIDADGWLTRAEMATALLCASGAVAGEAAQVVP
ncbi:EF-hand domain-containing protein [Sphingomonas sp. RS6]